MNAFMTLVADLSWSCALLGADGMWGSPDAWVSLITHTCCRQCWATQLPYRKMCVKKRKKYFIVTAFLLSRLNGQ